MPNHEEIDVESQLRGLFQEAEDHLAMSKRGEAAKAAPAPRPPEERSARPALSPAHILRPVLLGLEALVRASGENAALLGRLDDKIEKASEGVSDAHKAIPNLVESLQAMLDQKNGVNQRMFDALHEELKGYKDGFLLESLLKPVICDLISLYDDLSLIHGQMQEIVANASGTSSPVDKALLDRLKIMDTNLLHNCEFILEVLARLEVSMLPASTGKLDKQNQRAVALDPTENPQEDGDIVQVRKRGFFWKGRVLRAEDVVIKKWRQTPVAGPVSVNSQK